MILPLYIARILDFDNPTSSSRVEETGGDGDGVGGVSGDGGRHVGVEVDGDGDGGVTQALGDDLGMDAGLDRQGGIAVTQIVEADLRQTRELHLTGELP
jgi:hypothetical protein